MKRILWTIVITLAMTPWIVMAQESNSQLTAKQRLVNRQTVFNKFTDHLATVGKTATEKAHIRRKRQEVRRLKRLQNLTRTQSEEVQELNNERRRISQEIEKRATQN